MNSKLLAKYMVGTMLGGVLLLLPVSCGNHKSTQSDEDQPRMDLSQPLPEGLQSLIKGITDNDPASVASQILYPLDRPYPLKSINDSIEFMEYYPVLVDDSLRNVVKDSQRVDWAEVGWRGWTLDAGQYLWYEDGVYAFPYVSTAEKGLWKLAKDREMKSLAPSLRAGWEPVMCMKGATSPLTLYRIDYNPAEDQYRLAIYRNISNLKGEPTELMTGTLSEEGTAQNRIYQFQNKEGKTVRFEADPSDDFPLTLEWQDNQGNQLQEEPVTQAYWLDYTSR